jgi:hypothetical protein
MPNTSKHAVQHERRGLRFVGISATTGAVDTAIVGFPVAPTVGGQYPVLSFARVTTSANNGTIVELLRRGKYYVTFSVPVVTTDPAPISTVTAAISLDTTLLAVQPVPSSLTIRAVGSVRLPSAAATNHTDTINLSCALHLSDSLVGSPTLGNVRFHITNGAGATFADASVIVASVFATIEYHGDASGGS